VRILLDTHVWLWWLTDEPLSEPVAAAVGDPHTDVLVSAASVWEVSIKRALGKLDAKAGLESHLDDDGFSSLPITVTHAAVAGALPLHHGDPFDRMLVAQAQLEDLTLVTRDPTLRAYDVPILVA